jgi:hypothetical protein
MNRRNLFLIPIAATTLVAQSTSGTATHKRVLPPKPGVKTPGVQIPLARLKPEAVISIPGSPDWIAIGDDVWISNSPKSNVSRLDKNTNTVKQVIEDLPKACSGLAIGFGSLWVPTCGDHTLARVDLNTGAVTHRIPMGIADSEGGIAIGVGSVWIMTDAASTLSRISPESNSITASVKLPPGCYTPAFGFGAVWVTCTKQNTLLRIDPASNSLAATINVGPQPRFLAVGEGAVWTLNQGDGSITRVNPKDNTVAATIEVGIPGPGGDISAAEGSVWTTSFGFPVSRIDPLTNRVVQQFVGEGGDAIRAGQGSVWLSNYKFGSEWHLDPNKIKTITP